MFNVYIRTLRNWYKFKEYCKIGYEERPELFVCAGFTITGIILYIRRNIIWPEGGFIIRYKERYMIVRPDDDRLIDYPKEYVTDNYWLK